MRQALMAAACLAAAYYAPSDDAATAPAASVTPRAEEHGWVMKDRSFVGLMYERCEIGSWESVDEANVRAGVEAMEECFNANVPEI